MANMDGRLTIGLNVVLIGSKDQTPKAAGQFLPCKHMRFTLVDADDPEATPIVDEVLDPKVFSTGSVGFGYNAKTEA